MTAPHAERLRIASLEAQVERLLLRLDRIEMTIEAMLKGEAPPPPGINAADVRILNALRNAPGRIFSREQLRAIARPNSDATDRAIDHSIKRIRKHLGAERTRIGTVYGMGYRWDASKPEGA